MNRAETIDKKRAELKADEDENQKKLQQKYVDERQKLLQEEQDARRKGLLDKLKAQAEDGEKKL